jgi:hypothetical protein
MAAALFFETFVYAFIEYYAELRRPLNENIGACNK